MYRFFTPILFAMTVLLSSWSMSAEKTINIAVAGMWCSSCPYIAEQTISEVNGVKSVDVLDINASSIATIAVTYDDAIAAVAEITQATAKYGYPAIVVQ